MWNSKDAIEITCQRVEEKYREQLLSIEHDITKAINEGKFYCFVNNLSKNIITYLRMQGFCVKPFEDEKYKIEWSYY
jgi:hypothetical protein